MTISNITNIPYKSSLPFISPQENLINKAVPPEILKVIFSYLCHKDLQSSISVCRFWKQLAIDTANEREFSLIKRFSEFLSSLNKDLYPNQRKGLLNLASANPFKFPNLLTLKSSLLELKEKSLTLLKDLPNEDLNSIEKLFGNEDKSVFFEKIIILTRIYQKIDQINTITDQSLKSKPLRDISYELFKNGRFDQALEIAKSIPDDWTQSWVLKHISKELLKTGKINRAIEIAESIPNKRIQSEVLCSISKELLKNRKIDLAIEIAKSIPDDWTQSWVLKHISKELLKTGKINRAIEIAESIPNKLTQSEVFESISNELLKNEQLRSKAAKNTPNKFSTLYKISRWLVGLIKRFLHWLTKRTGLLINEVN